MIMMRVLFVGLCLALCCAPTKAEPCDHEWIPSGEFLHQLNGNVYAMTWWDPDGDGPRTPVIAVGGSFTQAGPVVANNIALVDPVTGQWSPLDGGVFNLFSVGYVFCLTIGPTGNLVAGGLFEYASGVPAFNVAEWDGTEWSALSTGTDGIVYSLTCDQAGNVIAGGLFQSAGGMPASNIATWNGTFWSAVGTGFNAGVFALAIDSSGGVIAGGGFTNAGTTNVSRIARWSGTEWSPFGPGFNTGTVTALLPTSDGKLMAGGGFLASGDTPIARIASWDGHSWHQVGDGFIGGSVRTLIDIGNGQVVAGGTFTFTGAEYVNRVALWDGTSWSPMNEGLGSSVRALVLDETRRIFAGGEFTQIGPYLAAWDGSEWKRAFDYRGLSRDVTALGAMSNGSFIGSLESSGNGGGLVKWDGAAWTTLTSIGPIYAIATKANGDFVIGGAFSGRIRTYIAGAWRTLGAGLNGTVNAVLYTSNGDIIAAGEFTTAGGLPANRIARWNGAAWSPLGLGVDNNGFTGYVNALAELSNGDIVAGGVFANAGGEPASFIARWDGSQWHPLGEGLDGPVYALAVLQSGELIVGGSFEHGGEAFASNIAKWNGNSWVSLGSGVDNTIRALAILPSGDVVAGGMFTSAGNTAASYIARWDGLAWSPLEAGVDSFVFALATLSDGTLAIGGDFEYANGDLSRHWVLWRAGWGPFVEEQPQDASTCARGTKAFAVSAVGIGVLSFQWQWRSVSSADWENLTDGVNYQPASSTLLASGSRSSVVSIRVLSSGSEEWSVRCLVSSGCESVASDAAALRICLADIDCSEQVDDADFVLFVNGYDLLDCQDPAMQIACPSDFNKDGFVDDADFVIFVGAYDELVCP